MPTIEVEVDTFDILWNMSPSEKSDLCQTLIDEGYGQVENNFDNLSPTTYTDSELIRLFKDVWDNRNFVDQGMIDELRSILRNKKVL